MIDKRAFLKLRNVFALAAAVSNDEAKTAALNDVATLCQNKLASGQASLRDAIIALANQYTTKEARVRFNPNVMLNKGRNITRGRGSVAREVTKATSTGQPAVTYAKKPTVESMDRLGARAGEADRAQRLRTMPNTTPPVGRAQIEPGVTAVNYKLPPQRPNRQAVENLMSEMGVSDRAQRLRTMPNTTPPVGRAQIEPGVTAVNYKLPYPKDVAGRLNRMDSVYNRKMKDLDLPELPAGLSGERPVVAPSALPVPSFLSSSPAAATVSPATKNPFAIAEGLDKPVINSNKPAIATTVTEAMDPLAAARANVAAGGPGLSKYNATKTGPASSSTQGSATNPAVNPVQTATAKPQGDDVLMADWRAANPPPVYQGNRPGGVDWDKRQKWGQDYQAELLKRRAADNPANNGVTNPAVNPAPNPVNPAVNPAANTGPSPNPVNPATNPAANPAPNPVNPAVNPAANPATNPAANPAANPATKKPMSTAGKVLLGAGAGVAGLGVQSAAALAPLLGADYMLRPDTENPGYSNPNQANPGMLSGIRRWWNSDDYKGNDWLLHRKGQVGDPYDLSSNDIIDFSKMTPSQRLAAYSALQLQQRNDANALIDPNYQYKKDPSNPFSTGRLSAAEVAQRMKDIEKVDRNLAGNKAWLPAMVQTPEEKAAAEKAAAEKAGTTSGFDLNEVMRLRAMEMAERNRLQGEVNKILHQRAVLDAANGGKTYGNPYGGGYSPPPTFK